MTKKAAPRKAPKKTPEAKAKRPKSPDGTELDALIKRNQAALQAERKKEINLMASAFLRYHRLRQSKSVEQTAEQMGISTDALYRLERGGSWTLANAVAYGNAIGLRGDLLAITMLDKFRVGVRHRTPPYCVDPL